MRLKKFVVSIQRPRTEEELAGLSEEAVEDVEAVEALRIKNLLPKKPKKGKDKKRGKGQRVITIICL